MKYLSKKYTRKQSYEYLQRMVTTNEWKSFFFFFGIISPKKLGVSMRSWIKAYEKLLDFDD